MKRGIFNVFAFYGLGLGLTWLTYKIFGEGIGHAPGPYILIPTLILLLGLFWTGRTIFNYYFNDKTDQRKAVIFGNVFVFILFAGIIFYMRKTYKFLDSDNTTTENQNSNQSGDSISMKYNGTIMYLQIKDSIYIDKRDSILETLK